MCLFLYLFYELFRITIFLFVYLFIRFFIYLFIYYIIFEIWKNCEEKNFEFEINGKILISRSSSSRNGGGSWARTLSPSHPAVKDVPQRDIHEVQGEVVPINMVKGIGHLRDPRLNKVSIKTIIFPIFVPTIIFFRNFSINPFLSLRAKIIYKNNRKLFTEQY